MRIFMSLLVAVFFIAGFAAAGPECDGLIGVENGLCKDFCEVLDCDNAAGPERGCGAILERYVTLTGSMPPCLLSGCPCASEIYPNWLIANVGDWCNTYWAIEGVNTVSAALADDWDYEAEDGIHMFGGSGVSDDRCSVFRDGYREHISITDEQGLACHDYIKLIIDTVCPR